MPRRARFLVPKGLPRRSEILACCLVVAVLAHVLFAQLTLLLAAAFTAVSRITRWRLSWLLAPAAVAVASATAVGLRAAAAGFAEGPAKVAGYLGARGHQFDRLLRVGGAFAGMGSWLPRQLPLAVLAGAAEAAIIGWLTWLHTDESELPPARPGLIVAARRAAAARAIRAGGVVARGGSCLGLAAGSGARITLAWSEAAGGIAVCGSSGQDALTTSFQLVHAAVRRRKPVLAVDLTADPGLAQRLAEVCAAVGAPLLVFGDVAAGRAEPVGGWATWVTPACYEPFRRGDAAQRASLVMAMLSWDEPDSKYRRSCNAYLQDVFELMDAAPGDPRVPVLDEVIHLLNPVAMQARMVHVPGSYPRRAALAERMQVSVSLVHAEPATTAQLTRQLRELRTSVFGRWLRPSWRGPAADIDLSRAVMQRAVVLFRLGGQPGAAMVTRLVCQDLLAAGAAVRGLGIDGDGMVWLAESGSLPRRAVADMIAAGPASGLPVLATTTSASVAVGLAELSNVIVAHRISDAAAARQLTDAASAAAAPLPLPAAGAEHKVSAPGAIGDLSALRDGEFLLAVKNPPRLVPRGLLVQARIPEATRGSGDVARHGAREAA